MITYLHVPPHLVSDASRILLSAGSLSFRHVGYDEFDHIVFTVRHKAVEELEDFYEWYQHNVVRHVVFSIASSEHRAFKKMLAEHQIKRIWRKHMLFARVKQHSCFATEYFINEAKKSFPNLQVHVIY